MLGLLFFNGDGFISLLDYNYILTSLIISPSIVGLNPLRWDFSLFVLFQRQKLAFERLEPKHQLGCKHVRDTAWKRRKLEVIYSTSIVGSRMLY